MAPGLPASRGLFSVLQDALSRGGRGRVRLNRHVFDTIDDFRLLSFSVAQPPTRLHELVPVSPSEDSDSCDACRCGMGGMWFELLEPDAAPVLWQSPFPAEVQQTLITAEHPHGTAHQHLRFGTPGPETFTNARCGWPRITRRPSPGPPRAPPRRIGLAHISCNLMRSTSGHTATSPVNTTLRAPPT